MYRPVMALLAGGLLAGLCVADPVPVTWAGGALQVLEDHASVRLVSERLVIEPLMLGTCVTVELHLVNDGQACDVTMAFPVVYHGGGYRRIANLAAEVDGLPVAVRSATGPALHLAGERTHCSWSTFPVHFDAGAPRFVTVFYDEMPTHERVLEGVCLPYVLRTGGAWRGTVDEIVLEIDLGNRPGFRDVRLTGDGEALAVERAGDLLRWRAANFDGSPEMLCLWATRESTEEQPEDRAMTPRLTGPDSVVVPAAVTINGQPVDRPVAAARYRRGRVALSADLIHQAALYDVSSTGGRYAAQRGYHRVQCDGWEYGPGDGTGAIFLPADEVIADAGVTLVPGCASSSSNGATGEGACRTHLVCEKVMAAHDVVQAPSPAHAVGNGPNPRGPAQGSTSGDARGERARRPGGVKPILRCAGLRRHRAGCGPALRVP